MSQNRSHAVMAQRVEAHDSLDDFPTPPWATRAFLTHVVVPLSSKLDFAVSTAWDPACNRGFMVRPLAELFDRVFATDIHDYGFAEMDGVADFLFPTVHDAVTTKPDWVITNPPFRLAEQFIARAEQLADAGYAMLVRTSFLETVGRYERLFSQNPPTVVAQFAERVPMVKGRCDPEASTATAYCWLVWVKGAKPRPMFWIPPCRAHLERANDYAGAEREEAA